MTEPTSNYFKEMAEKISKIGKKTTDSVGGIEYAGIVITLIIFFISLIYMYKKFNLDSKNCKEMDYQYPNMPLINSINENNGAYQYTLRDYYIKTAYNACCAGGFKNDFVNVCALKNCIKQGARCLDMEVYSLDDMPVIATSSIDDFNIKETYNSIPFASAMNIISDYAFSGSTCPCPTDPLILHLRIMSNNSKMYDVMANDLHEKLERYLLGPQYSSENNHKNISEEPLLKFKEKVIIIVDKSNPLFENTALDEYVNLASNSMFMRSVRFSYGIKFAQDTAELTEFNKKSMTICLPDLGASPSNYSSALPMSYGCQMVALSFQNYDANMQYYEKYFNGKTSAFDLKPEHLRYIPVTVVVPSKPSMNVSYATRTVTKPYVKYSI
jgi:hypothetical protein